MQKVRNKEKTLSKALVKLENKKGITLVSLVVTILLLLMLAGVAINLSMQDDGVIKMAEESVNSWKNTTEIENDELKNLVDSYKNEENSGIDWNKILSDLPDKYVEYLEKARQKGQETEPNIGIGTDGEVVNLDLWHYYKTDDGNGMSLGTGETCEGNTGYDKEKLVDGKVQGKMPQYVYIKSENKIYPITLLQCTFQYFDSLIEIPEIPSTVKVIGYDAFSGATRLTSIKIPNSVTSIENSFSNCSSLTRLTIPNSVTSIGYSAFYGCTGLTSITIPSSVTSIGDSAFWGCTALTGIVIPDSVTIIERNLFYDCTRLKSVTISNSATRIGNSAFAGCTALTNITIPNSVTSIDDSAFSRCEELTSITIPSSVTSIGSSPLSSCTSLKNIRVSQGNANYDSRNNCNAIIETSSNKLISGCKNTIIPSNITSIEPYAFSGCTELTSITIPNSITSIESSAFYRCIGLTSITIPNSVTSIGSSSFSDCTGLTSITIPSSVTKINTNAFYNCTGLASVYFEHTVSPTFESRCFYKSSGGKTTFYFKNSTVSNALTTEHYNSSYGTKSTNYSW